VIFKTVEINRVAEANNAKPLWCCLPAMFGLIRNVASLSGIALKPSLHGL